MRLRDRNQRVMDVLIELSFGDSYCASCEDTLRLTLEARFDPQIRSNLLGDNHRHGRDSSTPRPWPSSCCIKYVRKVLCIAPKLLFSLITPSLLAYSQLELLDMSSSGASPPSIDYAPYFQELITIQERAIMSFKRWAVGFVFIGVMIIALAVILTELKIQGVASQIVGMGGIFIGALSAFPYKEIAPRRSRIITYALLKQSFEKFPNLSDEDRKRLRDLADETIKRQI